MPIEAHTVAGVFADAWESMLRSTPGWWVERRDGAVAGMTRVPVPTLNGVWAFDEAADGEAISALLDHVAGTGSPHCLQARAAASEQMESLAASRGMKRSEAVPMMVLEPGDLQGASPGELTIRRLSRSEYREHAVLAAAGFEVDEEYFTALMTPELGSLPGFRAYLVEVDGQPVSTGAARIQAGRAGIFNIATPPEHRGRGYGAAVTAQAVRDAFREGADWAWLQASPAGLPVYERLGFETVESWPSWVAASAES